MGLASAGIFSSKDRYISLHLAAGLQVCDMINFFKRLRKGHLCKDCVPILFSVRPCEKALEAHETSEPCLMEKEDDVIIDATIIGEDEGTSQVDFASSSFKDELAMTQHLEEPCEIDRPIRCPHPEPCIIQDGRALKDRPPRVKRRGQLPFLAKSDYPPTSAAAASDAASSLPSTSCAPPLPITP